ncbi:MAG: sodium:solute symporter family transporter [Puniceicoccales bacterium]
MLLEYISLGIYLFILLILGAYFARFNKDLNDFVRGGAQGTWWLVGSSILMAGISAFTFTGNASAAFEAGPSLLVIYAANCAGFVVGAIWIGPWLRQTRAYTSVDVVRNRFGVPVEQFGAYFGMVLGPIGAAIQLYALSLFASTALGLPLTPTLITIAVIVVFYSTSGGKWAVMATDFVQALVMFSITLLVCFLALREIGGFGAFLSHFSDSQIREDFSFFKEPGQFPGDRYTLKWAIVIFFMQLNSQIGLTSATRYIAARDGREASKAAWFSCVLMAIGSLVWFIPPMVARFLFEADIMNSGLEKPTENAYAFIAIKLLPNGMVGMLIAAMFAATMSSMDSGLNGQVGILVRNVIPRLRSAFGSKHDLRREVEMRICHIATVVLGVLIVICALLLAKNDEVALFDVSLMVASVIGIPMSYPLFLGLWFKSLPKWSYFPIFIACLVPSLWSFIDGHFYENAWTIQERAMWIMLLGTLVALVCSFWGRFKSQKDVDEIRAFYKQMHTPIDYEAEVGESEVDYEQYFVIGKASLLIGGLICFLLIIPNSFSARLSILFVAAFVLCVGLWLMVGGRRIKRSRLERVGSSSTYQSVGHKENQ